MLYWKNCEKEEGLNVPAPAVHTCMLVIARTRVQANGNKVIVLLAYSTGEDPEFQREFLFELKTLILPRKKFR